jgi:hypothetical protein
MLEYVTMGLTCRAADKQLRASVAASQSPATACTAASTPAAAPGTAADAAFLPPLLRFRLAFRSAAHTYRGAVPIMWQQRTSVNPLCWLWTST